MLTDPTVGPQSTWATRATLAINLVKMGSQAHVSCLCGLTWPTTARPGPKSHIHVAHTTQFSPARVSHTAFLVITRPSPGHTA